MSFKCIGENIHIISKRVKTAIENRDKDFIQDLAKKQIDAGTNWIDLNIGPARRGSEGVMEWLTTSILEIDNNVKLSFDTSNLIEMESGLKIINNPQDCIINSTSGDPDRLNNMTSLAAKYSSNLIALTMSNETGIPKDPEGRLEIASIIVDKANQAGIDNSKIFIDPLVLPVSVNQGQAMEALNSIRVFKGSFDPEVLTTIGLSNISNGSPKEIKALINKVFAVMAMGCGLDSAILDMLDKDLLETIKTIESQNPVKEEDKLLINIYNMMQEYGELEDISYNKANPEEEKIYKTARIILNKDIYAHNYLEY